MKTDPKTQASEPGVDGSGRDLPNSVTLALGQNVKRHRHAAKLSQMNLAFESEMERSHVSRIERGCRRASNIPQACAPSEYSGNGVSPD